MKHIRAFNESFWNNRKGRGFMPQPTSEIIDDELETEEITSPEQLQKFLDKVWIEIQNNNLESLPQIVELQNKNSFIKEKEPYKEIYWNFVKKWNQYIDNKHSK